MEAIYGTLLAEVSILSSSSPSHAKEPCIDSHSDATTIDLLEDQSGSDSPCSDDEYDLAMLQPLDCLRPLPGSDEYSGRCERWANMLKSDSFTNGDCDDIAQQLKWDSLDDLTDLTEALTDSEDGPHKSWVSSASTRASYSSWLSRRTLSQTNATWTASDAPSFSVADRQRKRDKLSSFCRRMFQKDADSPLRRRKRDAVKACVCRVLPCFLPAHEQDVW